MRQFEPSSIWGVPAVLPYKSLEDYSRTRNVVPIARQLHTFLLEQIESWKPDLIIVVERKGTAILRALTESYDEPLKWPWSKVISSAVVGQMPNEYFHNKRILVFDDMMKTGIHLQELLKSFIDRGLWKSGDENLRVAVFAIHEYQSRGIPLNGYCVPHSWFYRDLTNSSFQVIRMEIIKMLQKAGSLMLDTEHLEVRVRLEGSFNKFVNALRRKAKAAVFHSATQRTNVTVLYADDEAHDFPQHLFPDATRFSSIVKKCRITQRQDDEFAIIPICFPAIPNSFVNWPNDPELSSLFGESVYADDMSRYYAAGLLGALEVLRWVLKDLAASRTNEYTILLPQSPDDATSTGGYSLDHLTVMYPTLDLHKLTQRILNIELEARSEGGRLRSKKTKPIQYPIGLDEDLRQDAVRLLQVIRHILDDRIMEQCIKRGEIIRKHPFGLRPSEIFEIGKKFGWEDIRISTLFDILIDEAYLEPHVQTIKDRDGKHRMIRTFEPDGEMVSELVRRYTTQWGLPYGF